MPRLLDGLRVISAGSHGMGRDAPAPFMAILSCGTGPELWKRQGLGYSVRHSASSTNGRYERRGSQVMPIRSNVARKPGTRRIFDMPWRWSSISVRICIYPLVNRRPHCDRVKRRHRDRNETSRNASRTVACTSNALHQDHRIADIRPALVWTILMSAQAAVLGDGSQHLLVAANVVFPFRALGEWVRFCFVVFGGC